MIPICLCNQKTYDESHPLTLGSVDNSPSRLLLFSVSVLGAVSGKEIWVSGTLVDTVIERGMATDVTTATSP